LRKLNRIAIQQMKLLTDDARIKRLDARANNGVASEGESQFP
jgi:hypothetical protein